MRRKQQDEPTMPAGNGPAIPIVVCARPKVGLPPTTTGQRGDPCVKANSIQSVNQIEVHI